MLSAGLIRVLDSVLDINHRIKEIIQAKVDQGSQIQNLWVSSLIRRVVDSAVQVAFAILQCFDLQLRFYLFVECESHY